MSGIADVLELAFEMGCVAHGQLAVGKLVAGHVWRRISLVK